MRTLFSTTEGVTHEGKESAASIRRNSPSESRMLEKKKIRQQEMDRSRHLPDHKIPPHADFAEQPHDTPFVIYRISNPHPTFKKPPRSVAILGHFDLESITMP